MNQEYRVYVEDTDMMGVVFFANYLKFFERARTDWLRERGFFLSELSEQGIAFAIRHLDIDYLYPARIDDRLIIETDVELKGYCQLQFSQKMKRHDLKLIAQALVDVVCVNQKMSPRRLPNRLVEECLK